MFIFRLIRGMVLLIIRSLRRRGWLYLLVLISFMSLDMIFPALGGNLTTIVLTLGPALLMAMAFSMLKRLDGTMPQFIILATYMATAGFFGLLKAWSKAAESSLPEILGPLSQRLFGTVWNFVAGVFAAVLGEPQAVPLPVLSHRPLKEHILDLDPLLTGLSLFVLGFAAHILLYGARRYGGETQATSGERQLAQNRLTSLRSANRVLNGFWGNTGRLVGNLLFGPRLRAGCLIIGFGAPLWWRPWHWPRLLLTGVVSRFMNVEMTPFDWRTMIVADAGNGALLIGGAGSGKTLIQIAWLMYSQSSKILIETQGNVYDKDFPLITAAGRTLYVISPDLGEETATINVLEPLNPASQDYWDQVMRVANVIIQEDGEHGALVRCTLELVATVIANIVYFAHVLEEEPTLREVYACLTDPEISQELSYWAEQGHPAFRGMAMTLAARTADAEFLNSLGAIYSPQLGFLEHPTKAKMVCGDGPNRISPSIQLHDQKADIALQIAQATIGVSGALPRLVPWALTEARIQLSAEDVKRLPVPKVTLWIDELAAFAGPNGTSGAPMLGEVVDFHRQKGIAWVFAAQNIQQIDRGWGEGTYAKWANSAVLRVFGKVGADPELDQHICDVAGKTLQVKFEKVPGAGGGWRSYQIVREEIDLLPPHALSKLSEHQMVAFVRTQKSGLVKLCPVRPGYFAHPSMKRRLARARRLFGGAPASGGQDAYEALIAETRQALIAKLETKALMAPDNDDQGPNEGTTNTEKEKTDA